MASAISACPARTALPQQTSPAAAVRAKRGGLASRPLARRGVLRAAASGGAPGPRSDGEEPTDAPRGSESTLEQSTQDGGASSSGSPEEEGLLFASRGLPYGTILALSSAGAVETAYLSWVKLTGGSVLCLAGSGPGPGCAGVLNSAYGTLFGAPLPAFGLAAYGLVAALSLTGASGLVDGDAEARRNVEDGIVAGASALATTSMVLIYVLATRLSGEVCLWCLASAGLSTSIAAAVGSGFDGSQLVKRVAPMAAGVSASVLLTLGTAFSGINAEAQVSTISLPYTMPAVSTHSSGDAVSMAKRLKDAGAKMYGAFWCSHCFAQKEYFGEEAMADFPYVECYPEGFFRGEDGKSSEIAKSCSDVNIRGFPTWVVNGNKYEGEQSLDQLEKELASLGPLPNASK